MAKIYFFNINAFGHVNCTLPIVNELHARGHKIKYFNYESFRSFFENRGIDFYSFESLLNPPNSSNYLSRAVQALRMLEKSGIPKDQLFNRIMQFFEQNNNSFELSPFFTFDALEMTSPLLDKLSQEKPDCLVVDNMLSFPRYVGEKLGIPVVSSTVCMPNKQERKLLDRLYNEDMKQIHLICNSILNGIRQTINLTVSEQNELYAVSTDMNLLYSIPLFQDENFDIEKNICIGASIDQTNQNSCLDFPIDKVNSFDGSKIYVSLGTVATKKDFYLKIIETFKIHFSEYLLIINVGSSNLSDFEHYPNIIICNYAPQLDVIQSVDAVICHGGGNTVMESLHFGKPVWAIPLMNDQVVWADRVQRFDLGYTCLIDDVNNEVIKFVVSQILMNATVIGKVRDFSAIVKEMGGYKKAASQIELYTTRKV